MPAIAPWMRPDLLPPAPSIGEAGAIERGRPVPVQFEMSLGGRVLNGADLVWSSASDRVVVAAELPALRHPLLARTRHALQRSLGMPVIGSAICLIVALSEWLDRSAGVPGHWQQVLFLGIAFGVLPLGLTLLELWRHRSVEAVDWDARIRHDRFVQWMAQRRGRIGLTLAAGLLLLFVIQLATDVVDDAARGRAFLVAGARRDLVLGGEPWRLLTAGLLHGNIPHLFMNIVALLALASQVEAIGGKSRLLTVFAISIVGGSVGSVAWQADRISVGASGGLFGLMGWLLAIAWRGRRSFPPRMWRSTAFLVLLNGAIGWFARDFIDNAAHAGGLATGLLAGLLTRLDDAHLPAPPSSTVRAAGWSATLALAAAAAWTYVRLSGG